MPSIASAPRPAVAAVAALGLAAALGCESVPMDRTTQGAVLGSLAGAGAGVLAAGEGDNLAGGLIGAAVGGIAGGLIGRYLDNQAREIDAIPDATVEQQADRLLVTFPGDTLFDSGSSTISPGAAQRLRSLAQTLNRYPASQVVVRGYTDSVGSEASNQRLSEDRANNVRNYLVDQGVAPSRITAMGFGEQFPVATNATEAGRQQNRRVEIEIVPRQDQLREPAPRY
jgi:outer membrane protein OmpA-like peptidoglycan-associated protein